MWTWRREGVAQSLLRVIEICQPIRMLGSRKPVANQNAALHVRLQGREKKNQNKPRRRKFSKTERAGNWGYRKIQGLFQEQNLAVDIIAFIYA